MTDDEKWLRFYQVNKNPGESLEDYKTRMTPQLMKRCSRCYEMAWNGKSWCTKCTNDYWRQYRVDNLKERKKAEEKYRQNNRKRIAAYQRERRRKIKNESMR